MFMLPTASPLSSNLSSPINHHAPVERAEVSKSWLTKELRLAQQQLARQVEERDAAVAERLVVTQEATQMEMAAASVRREVESCTSQLIAQRDSEESARRREQVAEDEARVGQRVLSPGALSRALEASNDRLENRVRHLCDMGADLRSQQLVKDDEVQTRALKSAAEERHEVEVLAARACRYEEQIRSYERSNCELHDEYRRQGEMLSSEISQAKESSWRESSDLVNCEQEVAAQRRQIEGQKANLLARVESLKQSAADANSVRGRLRRLVRCEYSQRPFPPFSDDIRQRGFDDMDSEQHMAEHRFEVAEAELAQLRTQRQQDEQLWSRQTKQLTESCQSLSVLLSGSHGKASNGAPDQILREEMQQARAQLSMAEMRSARAEDGLNDALSELSARQHGQPGQASSRASSGWSGALGRPVGSAVAASNGSLSKQSNGRPILASQSGSSPPRTSASCRTGHLRNVDGRNGTC